jgi:valyl-tRNA synthetase
MPFLTEELWGHLKAACDARPGLYTPIGGWEEALILAKWPGAASYREGEEQAISDFNLIRELVRVIRNARAENDVNPKQRIPAFINAGVMHAFLESQIAMVAFLARLETESVKFITAASSAPEDAIPLVVGPLEVYLPVSEMIDIENERARLTKELEEANGQVARLEALLAGPFSQKAPEEVVQKEREKLSEMLETRRKLEKRLDALE